MKNTPSNKTQALAKSMNMNIWVIVKLNQLFVRGSLLKLNFQKNKVVGGKTPFFVICSFCTPYSICLNIEFCRGEFVWKCYIFYCSTFNLKTVLQFFKKGFRFSESFFEDKVMKTFKISSDCQTKMLLRAEAEIWVKS